MSQAKLTHTLGNNIDQELLIGNHLGCFLKKLCRHMAQGTNGAGCFCRELKNDRHPGREGGWRKLRGEHGKKRVWTFQAKCFVVDSFCPQQHKVLSIQMLFTSLFRRVSK